MYKDKCNSKNRFSGMAENYNRFRPTYSSDTIRFLNDAIDFNENLVLADIGAGTGISSKMFLENGNEVYAVEPNEDMRIVLERVLSKYEKFHSVEGSSEVTNLQSESIDVVISAQSLHWFNPKLATKEFSRILKSNGMIVVLYNIRRNNLEGFMSEYSDLISKYGEKYINKSDDNLISKFFGERKVYEKILYNPQVVNFEELKGNLTSYSYIPKENNPKFKNMIEELKNIYDKYNKDGKITLEYDTYVSCCKIK